MARIDVDKWRPVGVESLEDAAGAVVRSPRSALVVAGPGAGKTELLAQRACYLLQTGTCPSPKRILAIAFKRDAAKNLVDRVKLRCGDQARRFDSLTLDAFAKGLVDRFRSALPAQWRPRPDYEIMVRSVGDAEKREWLRGAPVPDGVPQHDYRSWTDAEIRELFDRCSHGHVLPYDSREVDVLEKSYGARWWHQQLAAPAGRRSLSFPMLSRLAALILRTNPKLTSALRETYSFVFLDEFQDTTSAQYDLVRAAFEGSKSVLTAVGDSKQRIMVWAGAMKDVFDYYEQHFAAVRHHLVRNYRSAPELVRMQHAIASAIEAGTPLADAAKGDEVKGVCEVLEFATPEDEAGTIANLIEKGIKEDGLGPRDFCVLARARTSQMVKHLETALRGDGIRLRDESLLQDILAEPVAVIVLAILRLATRSRDAEAWTTLTTEIAGLRGWGSEDDGHRVESEARRLIEGARTKLRAESALEPAALTQMVMDLLTALGEASLRAAYRQYARGSYLHEIAKGLGEALGAAFEGAGDVRAAVDEVIGIDIVPAMTIHKSKGLEFHTIVFLGLEDSSWWAFSSQPDEEKRGFFVAFSRAIERVIFTFSDKRDAPWGRQRQYKTQIGDLYAILQHAGVPSRDCRNV